MKAAVAVVIARQIAAQGHWCVLRRQQPPTGRDHAEAQQHRRQVEQSGAAQPFRCAAADHVVYKAAVILYAADRAVHAGHSARDARALECRAGCHGAAGEAAAPAERHLAVCADVEKQMLTRQLRQPGGQQAGRDIPADIARHTGG